jgi:transposase-like protein
MNAPRSIQGPKQNGGKPKQEHLGQWMDRHSNLPLAEQQRALENEPGFRDLPPQTQQAMRNRLTQLNNMTPEQRRRMIEHTEAIEHLSPQQRQQVRTATEQYQGLPEDRRRLVARAFRDLREMPQPQRQALMNSDHFRSQFSDQERTMLSSLLTVEPYIPVQHPNDGPSYGK